MRHHHQQLIERGYKKHRATRYTNEVLVHYIYNGRHGAKPILKPDGSIKTYIAIWMTPATATKHGIIINYDNR